MSKWTFSILQSQKSELMLPIISINVTVFSCSIMIPVQISWFAFIKWRVFSRCNSYKPVFSHGSHQGFFLHILSLHLNFIVYFNSPLLHIFIFKEGNIRTGNIEKVPSLPLLEDSISRRFCYTRIWQSLCKGHIVICNLHNNFFIKFNNSAHHSNRHAPGWFRWHGKN